MIHQVAIKTLPQEWLWCETWCDNASKRYAKTIDLVRTLIISQEETCRGALNAFYITFNDATFFYNNLFMCYNVVIML